MATIEQLIGLEFCENLIKRKKVEQTSPLCKSGVH